MSLLKRLLMHPTSGVNVLPRKHTNICELTEKLNQAQQLILPDIKVKSAHWSDLFQSSVWRKTRLSFKLKVTRKSKHAIFTHLHKLRNRAALLPGCWWRCFTQPESYSTRLTDLNPLIISHTSTPLGTYHELKYIHHYLINVTQTPESLQTLPLPRSLWL